MPDVVLEGDVQKPWPGDVDLFDVRRGFKLGFERIRDIARLLFAGLASTSAALTATSPWLGIARRLGVEGRQL